MTLQTSAALDAPRLAGGADATLVVDTLQVSTPTEADLQELRAARWSQRRWEEWTVD